MLANFLAEDGRAGRVARAAVSRAEGVSLPDVADVETAEVEEVASRTRKRLNLEMPPE